MSYKRNNTWGTLRSVMLGSYFYPEFFSKITNPKVREPLMRMAEEINQDLDVFQSILKAHGAQVIKAAQPTGYFDESNPYAPTLHVRNTHAVVGDTMYQFNQDWPVPITPTLKEYCDNVVNLIDSNNNFYKANMEAAGKTNYCQSTDTWYRKEKYQELAGSSWPDYYDYVQGVRSEDPDINNEISSFHTAITYETKELGPLQGPNVISLPGEVVVSHCEYCAYDQWLGQHIQDRPVRQFVSVASHVDGCFAVIGNNTILGISPFVDYESIFPGYTVVKVPEKSYQDQIEEFNLMKQRVDGAWWLAGEEHNDQFINFVENNLKSWVGYVAESIFDVNVLALNNNTICVSNITPEVETQLKARGIDCIVVPWRHRFFVDGGLHCITLDLYRDD